MLPAMYGHWRITVSNHPNRSQLTTALDQLSAEIEKVKHDRDEYRQEAARYKAHWLSAVSQLEQERQERMTPAEIQQALREEEDLAQEQQDNYNAMIGRSLGR